MRRTAHAVRTLLIHIGREPVAAAVLCATFVSATFSTRHLRMFIVIWTLRRWQYNGVHCAKRIVRVDINKTTNTRAE